MKTTKNFVLPGLICAYGLLLPAGHSAAAEPSAPSAETGVKRTTLQEVTLSRVTLKKEKAFPDEILGELGAQADVVFHFHEQTLRDKALNEPMDIDVENKPFWEAVWPVLERYSLSLEPNAGGRSFDVYKGNGGRVKRPTAVSDGLCTIGTGLSRQVSLQYGGGKVADVTTLALQTYIDPELHMLGYFTPRITEAVDDLGQSWVPDNASNEQNPGGFRQRFDTPSALNQMTAGTLTSSFYLPLKWPAKAAKSLSVTYQFTARIGVAFDTVKFDKLDATDVSKKLGEHDIVLKKFQPAAKKAGDDEESYHTVVLAMPSATPSEIFAMQTTGSVRLVEADGKSFPLTGAENRQNGELHYRFDTTPNQEFPEDAFGAPSNVIVTIASKVKSVAFTVRMKDIPVGKS